MSRQSKTIASAVLLGLALATAACQAPRKDVPAGPAAVASQYLFTANETERGCSLVVREFQRYGSAGNAVLKGAIVTVGGKGSDLALIISFQQSTMLQFPNNQALVMSTPLVPVAIGIGSYHKSNTQGPGAQRDRPANAVAGLEFVTKEKDALRELAGALAERRLTVSYLAASARQPESWTLPSLLEKPVDKAHLAAFEDCVAGIGGPATAPGENPENLSTHPLQHL